jgi:hypothetical protein
MRLLRRGDDTRPTMTPTDQSPANPEQRRKPYEKPTLSEVALRPDEAVLGNCKTAAVSGPAQADCTFFVGCSSVGS